MEKLNAKEILFKRLREYLKAEEAILSGAQSYQIGDRSLTRANLKEIREEIDNLLTELAAADAGRGRTKRAVFFD